MDDFAEMGAGAGVASMTVHLLTLSVLLKRGLIDPSQLREMLDGAILLYESADGRASDQASVGWHVRKQLALLLDNLEKTSPEMKGFYSGA